MAWNVYIISNANRTLYVGIAADLVRRLGQHKKGTYRNSFTARYNFDRLVYFEQLSTQREAAERERVLKGWTRKRKLELIQASNPDWLDLGPSLDDPYCVR